ncbi:hypothetical protein ES703_99707 [subsurface metagenome]
MLDLKEERQFGKLRKLARELHIPIPEVFLTLEVLLESHQLRETHEESEG